MKKVIELAEIRGEREGRDEWIEFLKNREVERRRTIKRVRFFVAGVAIFHFGMGMFTLCYPIPNSPDDYAPYWALAVAIFWGVFALLSGEGETPLEEKGRARG